MIAGFPSFSRHSSSRGARIGVVPPDPTVLWMNMKKMISILSAICAQLTVCADALLFPQLRSILKYNPSLFSFLLLTMLPYFLTGLFLCMAGPVRMPTEKRSKQLVIPLFFILCNLLLLAFYFVGMLPLSSSSFTLPVLLIGYGLGRLICLCFPNA